MADSTMTVAGSQDFPERSAGNLRVRALLLVGVRVAGIAIQAVSLLVLARLLTPHDLGIYATLFASLALVRVIGPLGMDQLALKGVFLIDRADETASPPVSLIDASTLVLVANLIFAAGLATAVIAFVAPDARQATLLIVATFPAIALSGLIAGYVRGAGQNALAQIPESIVLPAAALALVLAGRGRGAAGLLPCVFALACAVALMLLAYLVIAARIGAVRRARPSVRRLRGLLREALQIAQALMLTALGARLPIFMATLLLGPGASALMEVASRFGTLGSVITGSVGTTFSPPFSRAYQARDARAARRLLRNAALTAGGGSGVLAAVALVAFPWLTGSLLPAYYIDSYPLLFLFCLATVINGGLGTASTFMLVSHNATSVRWLSLVQIVVIVLLGLALGPVLGAIGIGLAMVAGGLIRDGGSMVQMVRRLRRTDRADHGHALP